MWRHGIFAFALCSKLVAENQSAPGEPIVSIWGTAQPDVRRGSLHPSRGDQFLDS